MGRVLEGRGQRQEERPVLGVVTVAITAIAGVHQNPFFAFWDTRLSFPVFLTIRCGLLTDF